MGKIKDLTGLSFGFLTVVSFFGYSNDKKPKPCWYCACICGNKKIVLGDNLRGGGTKSCGCKRLKDSDGIIGKRFGKLVVVEKVIKNYSLRWLCMCDCGKRKIVKMTMLNRGLKSCGCLHTDLLRCETGDKNRNWKGGKTKWKRIANRRNVKGYKQWRRDVKKRASYKCELCYVSHRVLVSHHKASYQSNPSLRLDLNNGVCLCKECHWKFHTIYGIKNNTPEQYDEFQRGFQ